MIGGYRGIQRLGQLDGRQVRGRYGALGAALDDERRFRYADQLATQRHYHGTNVLNLWMAQTALGCETAEWMTFKQASDLVRAAGRSAAFVITQARARAPEIAQTHEALAEHGFPIAPVVIGQRAAYVRAITGGKAVTEFEPAGQAADEVSALWAYVKERLNGKAAEHQSV
jgi:hypothetical protein